MTEAQLKLLLMLTDAAFELLERAREVSALSDEECLQSIKEEQARKNALVEEVTES